MGLYIKVVAYLLLSVSFELFYVRSNSIYVRSLLLCNSSACLQFRPGVADQSVGREESFPYLFKVGPCLPDVVTSIHRC